MTTRAPDLAVVAVPVAAVGVLAVWDPAVHGGPVLCPMRRLTAIPCPGCGLTRALGVLARGHVADALTLHPLVWLVVVDAAVLWVLTARRRLGRPSVAPPPARAERRARAVAVLVGAQAALFVAVWVLRLATGSIDVVR